MNFNTNLSEILEKTPISVDVETEDLHGPSFLAVASARVEDVWYKRCFDFRKETDLQAFKELYPKMDVLAHNAVYDISCLYRDFKILPRSIAYDTCIGNHRKSLAKVAEFLEGGFPIYSFKTKPKRMSWEEYCSYHSMNTFLIWEQINKRAVIDPEFAVLFPFACITNSGYVKDAAYLESLKKDLFDFVGMEFDYRSAESRAMAAMKLGLPIPGAPDRKTITQEMIKPGKNIFFDALYQILKVEKGCKQETGWDFYFGGDPGAPYLGVKPQNTVPPELTQDQIAVWLNWPKWIKLLQLLKENADPAAPITGDYRDWYAKCYLGLGTSGRSLVKYFKQSPERCWEYLSGMVQKSPYKNLAHWMKSCDNGLLFKEMFGTLYLEEIQKDFSRFWLTFVREMFPTFQGTSSWVAVVNKDEARLKAFVQKYKIPLLTVQKADKDKWLYYRV